MKTQNTKLTRKGVTLIELTVVIAVILTLIGILFFGAQTYQRHANKSACVVLQNGINKAVRSFVNLTTAPPAMWNFANLTGGNFLPNIPVCPQSQVPFAPVNMNPQAVTGTVFAPCPTFRGMFTGVPMPGGAGMPNTYAGNPNGVSVAAAATATAAAVPAGVPLHIPNPANIGGW